MKSSDRLSLLALAAVALMALYVIKNGFGLNGIVPFIAVSLLALAIVFDKSKTRESHAQASGGRQTGGSAAETDPNDIDSPGNRPKFPDIYRELFENSSEAMCLVDCHGSIELANSAFAKMTGWDLSELPGRKLYEMIAGENAARLRGDLQELAHGEASHGQRVVGLTGKGGAEVDVRLSSTPLNIHGSRSVIYTLSDVTAQADMEQKLQQSQRLNNLGVLATGIAHEFNNLLVGIVGYVSFLKMKPLDEDLKRHIDVIESSAQKAANLSRQLLTFGRPCIKDTKTFEIRDLIDAVITLVKGTFPKNIAIRAEFQEEEMFLNADLNQLHQVLMNVFLNARDAMKDGGELVVSARPVTVAPGSCTEENGREPGKYLCISVSDTGTGMDEKTKEKIFDQFFTTKDIGEGSGLGLSTAYGIVAGHGGFIEVDSSPGNGSRFDVYLPAHGEKCGKPGSVSQSNIQEESLAQCKKANATVLVVDDEPTVREFLVDTLELLGYTTFAASSGPEALRIYNGNKDRINLVLTDMAMAEMNGIELARKLYEISPRLRVILSSGFDTEHIDSEMPSSIFHFIPKPYKIPDLSVILEKALEPAGQE